MLMLEEVDEAAAKSAVLCPEELYVGSYCWQLRPAAHSVSTA
jgi:hypothetical protein